MPAVSHDIQGEEMIQLDIRQIANDLRESARYIVVEAFKDRTHGVIKQEFDNVMNRMGRDDVIELAPEQAGFFADKNLGDQITFNNHKTQLVRVVSCEYAHDAEELATQPELFISARNTAVGEYVKSFARDVTHASVPTLYIEMKAYRITWFIWGYIGVPDKRIKK